MKRKKVFITGSSGFIARNFIELFKKKYRIVAPRHNELDLLNAEAVEKIFKKLGPFDFVIHTAIVGGNRKIPNTPEIGIANLRIFFNIVRNQKYFGKMINLGSGIEYGKERPLVKIAEVDFDKYVPEDNFGLYKYICAKYIENSKNIIHALEFGGVTKTQRFVLFQILCVNTFLGYQSHCIRMQSLIICMLMIW